MPPTHLAKQRTLIIKLYKEGRSIREIARLLDASRNTVRLWIARHLSEGKLEDHRRYNRGVRRVTDEQRKEMQQHYEVHPFTSIKDFAARFDVCIETIRNNLRSIKLHHRSYTQRLVLTEAQKTSRLNFAHQYLNFDWTTVIFSDEKTFLSLKRAQGGLHSWRYNNTQCTKYHVLHNSSDHVNVDMWGWMTSAGVGELVQLPTKINTENYVDVLEESMLPTVRTVYPQEEVPDIYFIQDNCPKHNTEIVTTWFQQHPDIVVIPWPENSPDLNPMENIWGLMAQMWENRNQRTRQDFEKHCQEIWELLRGTDVCTHLVGSINSRLQAVIENNGAYTRFLINPHPTKRKPSAHVSPLLDIDF